MFRLWIGIALAPLSCSVALAHHSYAEYDDKQLVEIEATTLNWLQRTNVPLDLFDTGGRVRFAGWPSRRSDDRMYALNMLAANGQEIVLFRSVKPRWGTTALGFASNESRRLYEGGVASGISR